MSSIIKSHHASELKSVSFREIDKSPAHESPEEPSETEEVVEEPQIDPLDELEATIQNRLMEAERRAQELESEGYDKGYAQGMKDGTETGLKSMLITKEQMEKLFAALQTIPKRVFKDYHEWFITNTLAIARQVIRKELDTHPKILAHLIGSLLDEVEASQTVTLYLAPKDIELLEAHTGLKETLRQSDRSFSLKPDPQLERGGCRIETELQLLDADIETRFALIEEALRRNQGAPQEAPAVVSSEETATEEDNVPAPSDVEEEEA